MSWDRVAVQSDWWVPAAGFRRFFLAGNLDGLVEPTEKVRPEDMGLAWQANALAHLWGKRSEIEFALLHETESEPPGGHDERFEWLPPAGGASGTAAMLEWFHLLPLAARLHTLVSDGAAGTVWQITDAQRDWLASWAAAQLQRADGTRQAAQAFLARTAVDRALVALEHRFDTVAFAELWEVTERVPPAADDMFARLLRDGLHAPQALAACAALNGAQSPA